MSKFIPPDMKIDETVQEIHQDMIRRYMNLAAKVYRGYRLEKLFETYNINEIEVSQYSGWSLHVEGCGEPIEGWQNKRYSDEGVHAMPEDLDPELVLIFDDFLMDVFCQELPGDPTNDLGNYIVEIAIELNRQRKEQG